MTSKPNLTLKCGIAGYYQFIVKHGDGSITEYPRFKNLVVNGGLDYLANGSTSPEPEYVVVGTGNTAPSGSQTELVTPLAYQAFTAYQSFSYNGTTTGPYNFTTVAQFKFAVGAVVGNIAEVGLGFTASITTTLFSRALIQVGGSPGTITLISSDQLIVLYSYEVQVASDVSGTISIDLNGTPTNYNYTMRPMYINQSSTYETLPSKINSATSLGGQGGISTATALVSAQSGISATVNFSSTTFGSYSSGQYNQNITGTIATGNTETFQMIVFNLFPMSFQILLNNTVSLTSTETFSFTINLAWASM
jgi:hypothetical protein